MSNLYGSNVKKPAAYCRLHKSVLTVKDIKKRKCLDKQCYHMKRLAHGWWEQRDEIQRKKKARKVTEEAKVTP